MLKHPLDIGRVGCGNYDICKNIRYTEAQIPSVLNGHVHESKIGEMNGCVKNQNEF